MGFLSRALVPRKVRRVADPVRTIKHKATPLPVRRASYQAWGVRHPVRKAGYRAIARSKRRR